MAAEIHKVDVGQLELSVTSEGNGPAVVLLHGFPEIGYSWRHQIPVLAKAGYRVLAPDMRGYGWSEVPDHLSRYTMFDHVGDVIGLLDAEGIDRATIVGHDWGSIIAPWVGLMRPDRVNGVAMLSVPFVPRGERSILQHIEATDPEGEFGYMLSFQHDGIGALLDEDPISFLRTVYWGVSGARPENHQSGDEPPVGLPPHLSQEEFENYLRAFARTGLQPAINYYRNLHMNWEMTRPWHNAPLTAPTVFIGGSRDFVCTTADGGLGSGVKELETSCTDHRGTTIIDGAGHWVQQEAPDEVNTALIEFLGSISSS